MTCSMLHRNLSTLLWYSCGLGDRHTCPTLRPPNCYKESQADSLAGWLRDVPIRLPRTRLTPSRFPATPWTEVQCWEKSLTLITLFGMQNLPMCFRRQDGRDSVLAVVMVAWQGLGPGRWLLVAHCPSASSVEQETQEWWYNNTPI